MGVKTLNRILTRRYKFIPATKILRILMMLSLSILLSAPGDVHALKLEAFGLRGGVNLKYVAIPPTEKYNFYKADIFMVHTLPWGWHYSSGWDVNWRLTSAAGILRGGGDQAFVVEVGPGIAFRKQSWRLIANIGTGLAALSRQHFGSQDMGGPVQIVGTGGLGFDLGSNLVLGWRFHHISDATIYGCHSKGVDTNLLELGYHF